MNIWDTFRIRSCWHIIPLYLSSIGKLLFLVAHIFVGRIYHRLCPPPLIVLTIDLRKVETWFWKIMYKAFFALRYIYWKYTMNCSALKISLLSRGRSCNQVKNVIMSLIYLKKPWSWESTCRYTRNHSTADSRSNSFLLISNFVTGYSWPSSNCLTEILFYMYGEVAALGIWGVALIALWEALSHTASTSVTVFYFFRLIIDLGSILRLSMESMRESGEAASLGEAAS